MKKRKNESKKKIVTMIIGFSIIIVLLSVLLVYRIILSDNYYKIDSRVTNLKNSLPIENSGYKTMGWLKIQGTDLDLPVVRSDDPDEMFPVELENFVWSENEDDNLHNNIMITGHNIFNLSAHPKMKSDYFHRFEELMSFIYYDFAKDNKYIQLTIDENDYIYKVFAVAIIKEIEKSDIPHDDDIEEDITESYIDYIKKKSMYDYDVDVNGKDKLITLSTCTRIYGANSDYEFYVVGRQLREDEKINNYKVTKNKNYTKIEKKLKGDEKDEESKA